jgi:carbon-monoxide dehydrogenase medium subunit
MIPRFAHARPRSLEEAFAAHADAGGDAAWYAGGTELLQVMKMGFAEFGTLIDLKGIADLDGIEVLADGWLRIGATATHRRIERSAEVARELPGLVALEAHLANVRVRNQGTLGGNLAFAEPHSDPATFLLACGASVELAGPNGRRRLAIDEFVLAPLFTAREADEILVAVHVPPRRRGEGRAYEKIKFFERPAVSVATRLSIAGGAIAECEVAVGSMTEVPTRVPAVAGALVGAPADADGVGTALATAGASLGALEATEDLNGSADYKRHLAAVLLRRSVLSALAEARSDA